MSLARLILFLAALSAAPAFAASDSRALSVGAGFASPSKTSALVENPAGLTLNDRTRLVGAVTSTSDDLSPLGYGGGLVAGNGKVGAGAHIQKTPSAKTEIDLGLAFTLPSQDVSAGLHLKNSGGSWSTDLGLLLNTRGRIRLGAVVFDPFEGIEGYGAGLAASISNHATIAVDATTDEDAKGLRVKPGLGIVMGNFQAAHGYGVAVDKTATSRILLRHSFALGFKLAETVHLEGYYNQIEHVVLGVAFKI